MTERFDAVEVKRRLAFLDLMAHEGIAMRRAGPHFVACCPFHEERTGSFTVHGPDHDHGHCYGCGWNGDIFDFWRARRGVGFADALAALASLASVSPAVLGQRRIDAARSVPQMTEVAAGLREKPALPRLRGLNEEEQGKLSALRALSREGIAAAAADKRVGWCLWPQYLDRNGAWAPGKDAAGCWVVTDGERRVAQFRRLDGGLFQCNDREIKCWTKGSPTWPLGAAELAGKDGVLLVEGGADGLAAYHFLWMFGQLGRVGVCMMLGASCGICADALPFFNRKRVRIMMQEDEPKARPGAAEDALPVFPGREAAARWTGQLVEAGAAVETFSLAGLAKKDGARVKDVNDLALVDEAAWMDGELRAAFVDFEF